MGQSHSTQVRVLVVGFTRQKDIKTGATLLLGDTDGNSVVNDINNKDCHSVNVAGFENPFGGNTGRWFRGYALLAQMYIAGDIILCLPTAPVASDFVNVEHVKLTRATSTPASEMNIIATQDGQGFYPIPKGHISNISYGDSYSYGAEWAAVAVRRLLVLRLEVRSRVCARTRSGRTRTRTLGSPCFLWRCGGGVISTFQRA